MMTIRPLRGISNRRKKRVWVFLPFPDPV